jgi:hypothetical protein
MIVCGLSLSPAVRSSLRHRLVDFQFESYPQPALLAGHHICFPDLPLATISDLLSYGLPVQVWTEDESLLDSLYDCGIAAVHFPASSIVDPLFHIPSSAACALLFTGNRSTLNLFRQLFLFAGIRVRADLRSSEEFVQILPELRSGGTAGEELHVVLDLDRGDFLPALHALNAERRRTGRILRLWAFRDFSRPGPDPLLIQRSLLPFTRRIFEPHEAALALIEALFLYDRSLERFSASAGPLQSFDGFHDATHILTGRSFRLLDRNPDRLFHALADLIQHLRPSLPFHWLYRLYERRNGAGGLLLTDARRRDA